MLVSIALRQCFVYLGDVPLPVDVQLPTSMFTALTVEVFPPDDDIDDFSSFMAFGHQRSHRNHGAPTESVHANFVFQLQSHLSTQPAHVTGGRHFRIRTWFLHFSEVSYWTQARLVDLPLVTQTWTSTIRARWADQLRDGQDVSFHYVLPAVPDLPRPPGDVVLADVIVTQGEAALRAGLATVYPPDTETFYNVAISFPTRVSGMDIVTRAHVQQHVPGHRCFINHAWQTIPVTTEPVHVMEHGHSFTVRFSGHHMHDPGAVVEGPSLDVAPPLATSPTNASEDGDTSSAETSNHEASESEIWASDDEVMEGVHVYSLARRTHHVFVRWTTYNAVLMDVARQLRLRLRDVIGLHYLAVPTVDQHEAEEGVILQYVNDLPIGSPRKLGLVDMEIHFHASTPALRRQVHQLPARLSRDGLLAQLHLLDYCMQHDDRCQLFWNNVDWPSTDHREHDTQHGLYLRVIVLPLDDQIDDETFGLEVDDLLVDSDAERTTSRKRSADACDDTDQSGAASSSGLHRASKAVRLLQHAVKRFRGRFPITDKGEHLQSCTDSCSCSAIQHVSSDDDGPFVGPGFAFNADAPAFQPGVLTIMQQSELVQNLFEHWNQAAITWEDEPRTAHVNTWFVSHHLPFPRCLHSRKVALSDDVSLWEETIKARWHDQITPASDIALFVVTPNPPHMEPEIAAHVIVVQSPHAHWISSLVSVYDRDWHLDDGPYLQIVITTTNPLHFAQVVQQVGYEDICITSATPRLCTAWWGNEQIVHGHPLHGQNGYSLVLRIAHAAGMADERLTDGQVAHTHRPQPAPQLISLEKTIDAPVFISVDFRAVQQLRLQILNLHLGCVRHADQIVKWHPSTQSALLSTPIWQNETPIGFSFFTDGSSAFLNEVRAASTAIVLVVHTPAGDRFGGFRCFQLDPGAFAPQAEMTGVFAATLWAQQLCETFACLSPSIAFHFDCLVAGFTANGTWRIQTHVTLQTTTRSLVQWLERRYQVACHWHHVFAHNGHPWNEAADAISWAVVSQWIDAPAVAPLLAPFECSKEAHWLWMLEAVDQGDPAFPPIGNGFMQVNATAPFVHPPDGDNHPMPVSRRTGPGTCASTPLTLRCATANVLTLHPTKTAAGTGISARMESLVRSFASQQVDIVGVQETRSQMQGHTTCEGFHVLSSPACKKGVGGVQLWINSCWATPHGPLHVDAGNLHILAATSQRMVVRLCKDDLRLILIVAHAPACPTFEDATAFWSALTAMLPSAYRSWPLIAFLDANARVGSEVSDCIGPYGAVAENLAGECFHSWLHQHSMCLPQTDMEFHQGSHETWFHPSEVGARIDFIAIDQAMRVPGLRTWVSDMDLTIQKIDHAAVIMEIPLECSVTIGRRPLAPRSAPTGDDTVPIVPWNTNVHTHANSIQLWMHKHQPHGPVRSRRKRHLQDATWVLIEQKRWHWKRCRQIRHAARVASLRAVFEIWRSGFLPASQTSLQPWLRVCDHAFAYHLHQHQRFCQLVLLAVRSDDRRYYEQLVARQSEVAADEGLTGLWRCIKHLLPKSIAKRKSSIKCIGPQVADLTKHYCQLEAGHPTTYATLLAQCHQRQKDAVHELPLVVNLCDIPSRTEIESLCKLAKAGKAPGLDGIQAETLQRCMQEHSEVFFALLFKIWVLAAEPAQFKGGSICSIAKKHGSSANTDAAQMRGIMLLDSLAKLFHALIRKELLPWATANKLDTQFGGYKGQQTIFATVMLRSYANYVAAKQVSCAIIFVDVRSAFHCLLRQHAFGTGSDLPPPLLRLLHSEGLDVDHLLQQMQAHADDFATAPAGVARVMRDAHQNTWFVCPGSDVCFATERGSRPGSPIADLAYNVMMSSLLSNLQKEVDALPGIQLANAVLQCRAPLLAWVDDVALPVPCLHADHLDALLEQTMIVMHKIFASYGLRLNCSPGKTEAIVQYRGAHAPALRRQRFIDGFGRLPVAEHDDLRIVSQYTHLGIVVAQHSDLSSDLAFKIGKASSAMRSMSRALFYNRRLAVQLRLQLFDTLILPIIFYGSGSWPLLSARLFQRLSAAITKWQRQIIGTGYWTTSNVTDAALPAHWKIPSLAVRLAKHRLLFLFQLHRHAPLVVWDMLTAEDDTCRTSWLQAVRHALKWLATFQTDVPASDCTAPDLFDWMQRTAPFQMKAIRHAVRRHLLQEHTAHHVLQVHQKLHDICSQAGVTFDQPPTEIHVGDVYKCDQCSRSFSSIQGLSAHRWKAHGSISVERRYVFSGVCECCRRCFWTAQRLQQHIRYSKKFPDGCFWWLRKHIDPLDRSIPVVLPEVYQGLFRLPWTLAAGPEPPTPSTCWDRQMSRDWQLWTEDWRSHGFPEDLSEEICTEVHAALTAAALQWRHDDDSALSLTWCTIVDGYEARGHDAHHHAIWAFALWGRECLYELPEQIEDPDLFAMIEEEYLRLLDDMPVSSLIDRLERLHRARPPVPEVLPAPQRESVSDTRMAREIEPIASTFSHMTDALKFFTAAPVLHWPPQDGIPICELEDGRRVLLILHLFSGRRRAGDCHEWAHALVSQYFSDLGVVILSIDTAVCGELCDLLRGPGLRALHTIVEMGLVAGTLSGPPCETWSAARHLPPPEGCPFRWPRPLRSADQPWGLELLTYKELKQLSIGSALMLSNIEIEIKVILRSGAALQEHPAPHDQEEYASVWRTAVQRVLCRAAPHSKQIRIQQWKYGSTAVKPTIIRAMGLPYAAQSLHRQADPHRVRPEKLLQGVDEATGLFRTAQAKEYPKDLCRALVVTLFEGLAKRRRTEGSTIRYASQLGEREAQWLRTVTNRSKTVFADHFLPDYQPN